MTVIEKLKEEKIKFISWIVLFLSSVGIQFADLQINNYQTSLRVKLLEAFNIQLSGTDSMIQANMFLFKQLLPWDRLTESDRKATVDRFFQNYQRHLVKDENVGNLLTQLREEKITLSEYFGELTIMQEDRTLKLNNFYNKWITDYKEQLIKGTVWNTIKYILFVLMTICIVYLGIQYFSSTKEIKKQLIKTENDIGD